ncbi:unnamed protein product [Victoria cruziana]
MHPLRFFRGVSPLESWWSSSSRISLFKRGEPTCKCLKQQRKEGKLWTSSPSHWCNFLHASPLEKGEYSVLM